MSQNEGKEPFWVKCGACGHIWTAAYLPMVAEAFARAAKASCPMCAAPPKQVFIAKQKHGVLLEPAAAQGAGA
jgi:rubredoxin